MRGRSDWGHQQTLAGPLLHRDPPPDLSEGRPAHIISLSRILKNALWAAVEFKRKNIKIELEIECATENPEKVRKVLHVDHQRPRLPAQKREDKKGSTQKETQPWMKASQRLRSEFWQRGETELRAAKSQTLVAANAPPKKPTPNTHKLHHLPCFTSCLTLKALLKRFV